jgi:hypothetical protein
VPFLIGGSSAVNRAGTGGIRRKNHHLREFLPARSRPTTTAPSDSAQIFGEIAVSIEWHQTCLHSLPLNEEM